MALGLAAVVDPGDDSVETTVGPALKAFEISTRGLATMMKDHWVGFYTSFDHPVESIPDAIPSFVFIETDQHVGPHM